MEQATQTLAEFAREWRADYLYVVFGDDFRIPYFTLANARAAQDRIGGRIRRYRAAHDCLETVWFERGSRVDFS